MLFNIYAVTLQYETMNSLTQSKVRYNVKYFYLLPIEPCHCSIIYLLLMCIYHFKNVIRSGILVVKVTLKSDSIYLYFWGESAKYKDLSAFSLCFADNGYAWISFICQIIYSYANFILGCSFFLFTIFPKV